MSKTLKRVVIGVLAVACVIPSAALAGGKGEKLRARMTGGGHVLGTNNLTGATVKVTHGFELHCNYLIEPQRLQVNWSGGNSFHLTQLDFAACSEEGYDQENPRSPIDTYRGRGVGRITTRDGGKQRAYAVWTFIDDGEPGGANEDGGDVMAIRIYESDNAADDANLTGDELIMFAAGELTKGNHQAHRSTGSKAG